MGATRLWLVPLALAATVGNAHAQDGDSLAAHAIARRAAVLARYPRVRYATDVKFVARDAGLPADSSASILLISETRASAYWEATGDYLETIRARRRTGRGGTPGLASIAEVGNIERDRIELEEFAAAAGESRSYRAGGGRNRQRPSRYAIVSPVAADAPRYYDYALLDTVRVAGRLAWRLAIRPRTTAVPLLTGTMDVADSTWDVMAIVGDVRSAIPFGAAQNLRYEEQCADAGGGAWLPATIQLTGELRPRVTSDRVPRQVAGFRVPGVPRRLLFEQVAMLDSFRLDPGDRPIDAGEYRVVVAEGADQPDSAAWSAGVLPLTDAERAALSRADSAERHPGTVARLAQDAGAAVRLAGNPGFFHYNRVDGAFLGASQDWRAGPALTFTTRLGYGVGSELWQYRVGGQLLLSQSRRLSIGAFYHDETQSWPSLVSSGYNATARAFFARTDPHDYYRERGVNLFALARLLDRTRLELRYADAFQSTLTLAEDLSGSSSGRWRTLPNPPIVDGRMRSLAATLSWDSRAMMRSGGRDYELGEQNWTHASLAAEVADPALVPDRFAFRRYTVQLERQQQWPLGSTLIAVAAGAATGDLPPQRYFTVDFGMGVLAADGIGFNTMRRSSYSGSSALMVVVRHDFGRQIFAASGVPLLRSVPFTLSVHGGAFWTRLAPHAPLAADTMILVAPTPYREVGFSLGNLTPFLSPFNFAASFSWQLSAYPTRRFSLGLGVTGP